MKKIHLLSSILFLLSSALIAQEPGIPQKQTHWMSPEERLRLPEVLLDFVETPPPAAPVRNVAEFDYMQGVLIRYPFGIPMSVIKEMAEDVMVTTIVANVSQQNTVINQYVSNGVDTSHCDFLIAPNDSYWTRDYGPWFASDNANNICIVDFPYNRPSRPNDDEIPNYMATKLDIERYGMNLIHTGGNYMTDGMGQSASTTLVEEENPTLTTAQIQQKVHDYLGIETYHLRPDPNNTYIDHIDCWGKFLAPDKILIRKVPTSHPQYDEIEAAAAYWETQICSYGYYYKVFRVNTPNNQPYTNSLILNNKVLIPKMNSSWDDSAIAAYQQAMPGYEVLNFTALGSAPWESTDALHCRAIGVADVGLLYIRHVPLSGNQPAENNFLLDADLIPCSDSAIYSDSVLVRYRVDYGSWQETQMVNTTGYHYTGIIPKQDPGSVIQYYLYAADKSGRHAQAPFIGAADPFTFTAVYTDLTAVPDTLRFETYDDCIYGKYTAIQNFTSSSIDLTDLEPMGFFTPGNTGWAVEPYPVPGFPYPIAGGDSLRFRVIILIPVNEAPAGYWIDTLHFSSTIGTHHIILLMNDTLQVAIGKDPALAGTLMMQVYPNPLRSSSVISFSLNRPSHARLEIFDMNGRLVRTLLDGRTAQGTSSISWNGLRDNGMEAANGIYLIRLTTEGKTITKQLVVLKD